MKNRFSFFRSLRFRIMVILILVGIIPAFAAVLFVVRGYENRAVNLRSINVKNQCDILSNTLVTQDYIANPNNEVIDSELALLSTIYNGRIMIVNSEFVVIKDTFDLDTGRTSVSHEIISCAAGNGGTTQYDRDNSYIEIVVPIQQKNGGRIDGVLLASVSTNEINQNVRILERRGILLISVITAAVLIGGFFLAGVLVRPFRRVTNAIEEVTDGIEDEAVSVPDYTETQQITDAFNMMLRRVKTVDNSKDEFVSNVSHELKTPMTSMKVLADSLNSQENVPVEIYREFMQDITVEIDRENKIISDLLEVVRMGGKHASFHPEKTDIGELLAQVVRRLRPIAEAKSVGLIVDCPKQIFAEIDELKLTSALTNLMENGIKYNVEGGFVRASAYTDRKTLFIEVSDSGIGIPEDQQEHIFERFYRVDKSHSTQIEGTGLGLDIARQAIRLHRGTIQVESRENEGTIFLIRMPLSQEVREEAT